MSYERSRSLIAWRTLRGQFTIGDLTFLSASFRRLRNLLEQIISEHTGQPLEKVSKDMERDYYMNAEEAQTYGIVDQVVSHR